MMNLMLLNHLMPKVAHGFNHLATLIHYVHTPPELLPIMLLLGSTGYNFSLAWTSHAHATIILSNLGDIYYMSAVDLMGIGTPEETR